jgi:Zn-dependent M32 family carboxypeptidase
MSNCIPENAISELVETLANIEHERWSHWQRYMHGKCERQADDSLKIPRELVLQWERQSTTSYSELTEAERESDREQVRRYLPVVMTAFDIAPGPKSTGK